ncbi:MAG: hypothetical protein WD294_07780 [Phycisphaeraceae bacterium]
MGDKPRKPDSDSEFEPIPLADPDPPPEAPKKDRPRKRTPKPPHPLPEAGAASTSAASASQTVTVGQRPSSRQSTADKVHCHQHPEEIGKWWCSVCQAPVCRDCVVIEDDRSAKRPVAYCKGCGKPCKLNKAAKYSDEYDNSPFRARLARGFAYPVQGYNWVILLMLSVIMAAPLLLSLAFPLVLIVFFPFVALWLVTWMFDVLGESARGSRDMPNLALPVDFWQDLVRPVVLFLCAWFASFGPALIAWYYIPEEVGVLGYAQIMAVPLLAIAGHIVFPMMMLVVTLYESPLAIRPSLIIDGINTMGIDYLILLVLLALVPMVVSFALTMVGPFAVVLAVPAALYLMALNMHLLGQLYHANRRKLGWFI